MYNSMNRRPEDKCLGTIHKIKPATREVWP